MSTKTFDKELQTIFLEWRDKQELNTIQRLAALPQNVAEAEQVLQHLAIVINEATDVADNDVAAQINQVLLNLAFRCYYQLQRQYSLTDKHFGNLCAQLVAHKETAFYMLYAVLLTEQAQAFQAKEIKQICVEALEKAVRENHCCHLPILKALNLLLKKCTTLQMHISLETIYHCMQCKQTGMREETLILFQYCCKPISAAVDYFLVIEECWPWTNRNKLYLLSCILNLHQLQPLLEHAERDAAEFFAGLRLSLSYKHLLAASQYLVKSLSKQQETAALLDLCVNILTKGNLRELENFYTQWFNRLSLAQKDMLFEELQQQPEMLFVLEHASAQSLRAVLILSMFARQVFEMSRLHFFKISTELITNCFQYELETQIFLFRFFVDNLSSFAIEDGLDFILSFVKQHKCVENARFRNHTLAQMPTIINYIAKASKKLPAGSTLAASIVAFFKQLQQQVELDIGSAEYQSQIFALKFMEVLLKSLYAEQLKKNSKQCTITHNQHLGNFLRQHNVFDASKVIDLLLQQLHNAHGYDDAFDMCITLLQHLQYAQWENCLQTCLQYCQQLDIDECALSALHAKVAVQTFNIAKMQSKSAQLSETCFCKLQMHFKTFTDDPLLMCRTKSHLFGYIDVMAEILYATSVDVYEELLDCIWQIVQTLLDMLNLVNLQNNIDTLAADFQHMDESLQILVDKSAYADKQDASENRKFLLISFWFTLRACCHVAQAVGSHMAKQAKFENINIENLEKCLLIHMTVSTRCRHKGAIEAAGLSMGKLTKVITSHVDCSSNAYRLLFKQLDMLFDEQKLVSTTRRGAGFSITLLHIIKNEAARQRPMLQHVMQKILQIVQHKQSTTVAKNKTNNCDCMEALTLHYLCVLVKDTELRHVLACYYSDVILAAIDKIDHEDWTVCNAALQLFGALVPKIVGQKQAFEFEESLNWQPTEITYNEILYKLPTACMHMLNYCDDEQSATRSIILYLAFLSNVEHLQLNIDQQQTNAYLLKLRPIFWRLLSHRCEKLRKLAATCFVRAHEIRFELPQTLLKISHILTKVRNENFFIALIFTLMQGISKLSYETVHTIKHVEMQTILQQIKTNLLQNSEHLSKFKPYTLNKFIELLRLVKAEEHLEEINKLIACKINEIGYNLYRNLNL